MKIKAGKVKKQVRSVKQMTILAGIAMKNGFYTEAVWIISAIMEARLKKIILITEKKTPGAAFGLEQHLKRIKLLRYSQKNSVLNSGFPEDLIRSLRAWKNSRNILIKDMLEMHVSFDRRERLAREGVRLLKELNKVYKFYKVAFQEPPVNEVIKQDTIIEQPEDQKKTEPIPESPAQQIEP